MSETAVAPARRPTQWVLLPLTVGALVALTVGILAKTQQDSSPEGYFQLFFSDPIHLKAWFATAAAVLAFLQLATAAWIFHRIPVEKPPWVNSLIGSAFFGAYAAKVLIIRMKRYPAWVIPTAGGLLFTTLIVVWYTSALWFFSLVGEGY